jgi:hypothetical protein
MGSITQIMDLSNNEGEEEDKFSSSHLFMKTLYYSFYVHFMFFWDKFKLEVVLNEAEVIYFLTILISNI